MSSVSMAREFLAEEVCWRETHSYSDVSSREGLSSAHSTLFVFLRQCNVMENRAQMSLLPVNELRRNCSHCNVLVCVDHGSTQLSRLITKNRMKGKKLEEGEALGFRNHRNLMVIDSFTLA